MTTPRPGAATHPPAESQCGATDDSQPVEQYDGSLGVSQGFGAARQARVGQLQWDDDLATPYTNPGNVNGVRWCTGTLISHNLFLTAGHCFDSNPAGWQVPRIDGEQEPVRRASQAPRGSGTRHARTATALR